MAIYQPQVTAVRNGQGVLVKENHGETDASSCVTRECTVRWRHLWGNSSQQIRQHHHLGLFRNVREKWWLSRSLEDLWWVVLVCFVSVFLELSLSNPAVPELTAPLPVSAPEAQGYRLRHWVQFTLFCSSSLKKRRRLPVVCVWLFISFLFFLKGSLCSLDGL